MGRLEDRLRNVSPSLRADRVNVDVLSFMEDLPDETSTRSRNVTVENTGDSRMFIWKPFARSLESVSVQNSGISRISSRQI